MSGRDAAVHYGLIEQRHREIVEDRLSPLGPVRWLGSMPDTKSISIAISRPSTPAEPGSWPDLDEWMARSLETMDDLFRPIVKTLDASEYVAHEERPDVAGGARVVSPSETGKVP